MMPVRGRGQTESHGLPDQSLGLVRAELVAWLGNRGSLSVSLGAMRYADMLDDGAGPEIGAMGSHIEPMPPVSQGATKTSAATASRMADRDACPDMRFEGGKP